MALDVPTLDKARGLMQLLDNVWFFKVGWQLALTAGLFELLKTLKRSPWPGKARCSLISNWPGTSEILWPTW